MCWNIVSKGKREVTPTPVLVLSTNRVKYCLIQYSKKLTLVLLRGYRIITLNDISSNKYIIFMRWIIDYIIWSSKK